MSLVQRTSDGVTHTLLGQYTTPDGATWYWTVPVGSASIPGTSDSRIFATFPANPGDSYKDTQSNVVTVKGVFPDGSVRFAPTTAASGAPDLVMDTKAFFRTYTKQ